MGVRHVALFRFAEHATPADVQAVTDALAGLPAEIDALLAYRVGPDLGLTDGSWDYAVVAEFADEAGYEQYRTHPRHADVRDRLIVPLLADRANVQYTV